VFFKNIKHMKFGHCSCSFAVFAVCEYTSITARKLARRIAETVYQLYATGSPTTHMLRYAGEL